MLRPTVGKPDFDALFKGLEGDLADASTAAMREATAGLKQELRDQVRGAGLGARLANTWRGDTYPAEGSSLNPAGWVTSRAPTIIDSFSRGTTIRPVNGAKYLWIPTKNVPRARGRVGRGGGILRSGALTPEELEQRFNTDFIIVPGKNGGLLAFMDVIKSLNAKTYRPRTKRRVRAGRRTSQVLMYVLRPTVRMPKVLDLDGPAQRWAGAYATLFVDKLR